MDWKRVVGKLFLVGAGMGGLVLVMFVLLPWLTAPPPPPQAMGSADIVAEVLDVPSATGDGQAAEEDTAAAPLVARRDNGEEVSVLFPAAEEPSPGEGAALDDGLPPVLSPEEVAAAMAEPEVEVVEAQGGEPQPAAAPDAGEALRSVPAEAQEPAWPPEVMVVEGPGGSRMAQMTLPPPEATREVQELLESLGYEPGPADGIWGDRTARAWNSFARDARGHEARTRLAQSRPESPVVPVLPERPAPAEGDLAAKRYDESQAGETQVGLPPQRPVQETEPVRVPGTLRGVMGYRLPLISRQEVPDQVVSGVLIPAHTTFVILRGGEWELVDLAPDEARRLEEAAEAAAAPPEAEPQPPRRNWNPLRLFRRQTPHQGGQ